MARSRIDDQNNAEPSDEEEGQPLTNDGPPKAPPGPPKKAAADAAAALDALSGGDDNIQKGCRLLLCGGGIVLFLGLYGVLQERIMADPYGGTEDGPCQPPNCEYFTDTVFLVLNNRIVAVCFACTMIWRYGESWLNTPPIWKYFAISVSNVVATTCQYEALKYVSFPVQMLGKSSKMVPVMIWGMIVAGKSYGWREWLISVGVTSGCVVFLMTGQIGTKHTEQGDSVYGLILLMGYLGADGFTSMFQEKLFGEHKTSKYNQMMYINLCSAIMSITWLLPSGQLFSAIGFAFRHPALMVDAFMLSCSATSGQFCIYSTIKEFGAVVFAACMNVRQVANIMLSIISHGHPITGGQWFGLFMVFGFLFYKSYLASQKKKEPKKPDQAGSSVGRTIEFRELSTKS